MGMTIEEIIAKATEEAEWFQKLANEDIASEQYYDELKIFREKRADYCNQIVNILRKYQKIQEIINNAKDSDGAVKYNWLYEQIGEVLEDGNDR